MGRYFQFLFHFNEIGISANGVFVGLINHHVFGCIIIEFLGDGGKGISFLDLVMFDRRGFRSGLNLWG